MVAEVKFLPPPNHVEIVDVFGVGPIPILKPPRSLPCPPSISSRSTAQPRRSPSSLGPAEPLHLVSVSDSNFGSRVIHHISIASGFSGARAPEIRLRPQSKSLLDI